WTPNRNDYGYGWNIAKRLGATAYEHGGGINGFNTMIVRMPEKKLLAVVLSNVNTNATGPIATGLIPLPLDQPVSLPGQHTAIRLAPEQLQPFAGRYANDVLDVTVRVDGDHIVVQPQGQGAAPFQPMAAARFFNDSVGAEIEFAPDVSTLTIHQ